MFFNFSGGRALMTTEAAGAGSVFAGGVAYEASTGALHVSYDTPASTDPRIGGVACKPTGEVYVTDAPPSIVHGGFGLSTSGQLCVNAQADAVAHSGAVPFTPLGPVATSGTGEAWDFDGSNDYTTRGANLTGVSDGKQGTINLWVRVDGGDSSNRWLLGNATTVGGSTSRFYVYIDGGSNVPAISGYNAAGVSIFFIYGLTSFAAGPGWHHILASWDLADANKRHLYVDGVDDLNVLTYTNDTIDYAGADWALGSIANGTGNLSGAMAECWFNDTYMDLSVEATRRKFISASGRPVFLGATGQSPTGGAPKIYTRNFTTNFGTGGNFTASGSLSAASSTPFGPTARYVGGKLLTVGSAEVVVTKAARDAAGLTAWPDGNFGVTKNGSVYTFYASNSLLKVAKTVGTLANPIATSVSAAINIGSLKDTLDFASGGPVYDAGGGLLLMFYHAERYPGGDSTKFYSTIRMAKSTDGGASWVDLGEIIRPNATYPQAFSIEVGGGAFIVKDGYFYVYFNDHNGSAAVPFCAARALVSDVVTAAGSTDVTAFSKWTAAGTWSANGLTGLGVSMLSQVAIYSDVAYNSYLGKYLAAVGTYDLGSIDLIESSDGETWGNSTLVVATAGVEEAYPSLIGTGSDPQELGQSFYIYYVSSVTGGFSRWDDATLSRRLLTLG